MLEQVYALDNTDIYSFVNPDLKGFCLSLYIRAGSLFEADSENGISHFFEHIVFRNLKRKYPRFYELLAMHGLDLQGCTYKEFIRFTLNGPSGEFGFASDILCSLFDEIKLNSDEFNNEKKRIKAEIREKDYRNTLDFCFNSLVWRGTPAEKTVLGYCKVLDGITVKKINEFRKRILSAGNFFVYVTGNVSQSDFEGLKQKMKSLDICEEKTEYTNTVQVNDEFFNRSCSIKVKNDYWHYIKFGFDIDCRKYPGGALDLLYAVLFKGDKALLHNYLSEDNPIIYSFESTLEQYDNIGNINFMFEVGKDKILTAVKAVVDALNAVKSGNFNFEANLFSEKMYTCIEQDNPDNLSWSLAYYNHILKTQPIDYSDENYGRYNVTKQQVMQAAEDIFRTCNMSVAVKGEKKNIKINDIQALLKLLD
ncbi:MAG: insulinase family protein [Clostridia bacterium]|nr:insulinase family protein [Clostridia bacterium]